MDFNSKLDKVLSESRYYPNGTVVEYEPGLIPMLDQWLSATYGATPDSTKLFDVVYERGVEAGGPGADVVIYYAGEKAPTEPQYDPKVVSNVVEEIGDEVPEEILNSRIGLKTVREFFDGLAHSYGEYA